MGLRMEVPALGTSEAGPAGGGGGGGYGSMLPQENFETYEGFLRDFLISRDKFTVHTRPINLYSIVRLGLDLL